VAKGNGRVAGPGGGKAKPAARTAAEPAPGPTLTRPKPAAPAAGARPGAGVSGVNGKAAPGEAVAASGASHGASRPRNAARLTADRIKYQHHLAAKGFGAPELELDNDEAAEVVSALSTGAGLCGMDLESPFWMGIGAVWSLGCIYLGKLAQIRERVATGKPSPAVPAAGARPGPAPSGARAAPEPVPPGSNLARPAPPPRQPTAPSSAMPMIMASTIGRPPPAPIDPHFLEEINAGLIDGITPPVPGVPRTTAEEREAEG
jgi:hypothetical protein